MKEWKNVLVSPGTSIRETIRVMDKGALKIALVVDPEQRLLGTVSDGDVRRGILKGCALEDSVQQVMNTTPTTVPRHESREKILALMRTKQMYQIPVIDEAGLLVGLEVIDTILSSPRRENWVVLMAGGLGSRLKQLTKDIPKPLLKVGDKPILETILANFIAQGFNHFFISVNYKSELIKEHFGNGSQWGVQIEYLHESKRLGTAGALSLLPEKPSLPLVVMNGDLLTKVDFGQLLDFHREHRASATMCVQEYHFEVPYGVVSVDGHRLLAISEKPVHRYFVNAGIYVLEPDKLNLLPHDVYSDMTSFFEKLIDNREETAVFPIREYWLDIGRIDDFEKAKSEYLEVFE